MSVVIRSVVSLALGALVAVSGTSPAAQPDQPKKAAPNQAKPVGAGVGAQASISAFNALDAWVRALAVPEDATPPEGLDAMTGCAMVLRLDHHIIGRATLFGGPDAFVRAAREAIAQAAPRLPVGHDALAPQQRAEAAKRIAISLELAGTLIPVKLETFADADEELQPGLDGVAARFGDKLAGAFPAAMLVMNKSPGECLAAAISQATGDATLAIPGSPRNEAGAIAVEHKATYYRFRVMHLAQTLEGRAPEFLFRGGQVVRQDEINGKSLGIFADDLARNLAGRVARDGTLAGTLLPALGRYSPETADPIDQAMAAAALATYAEARRSYMKSLPQIEATEVAKTPPEVSTLDAASRLLSACSNEATKDPLVASAWTLAATTARRLDSDRLRIDPMMATRIGACVASAYDPETGWLKEIKPAERSLVTFALALEAGDSGPDDPRRARATAAIRSLYIDTPPKNLVSQMPWLGQAELALAGDGPIPSAVALRDMRELVWKNQLTPEDAGPDGADLEGGIVFPSSRNPLPNWLSARPMVLLARMCRDPRLTDPQKEKLREVSHLLATMRFLRQLMIDDASIYSAEDPDAYGGIRASLWDQRQPVEATVITLMAVSEMLKTLSANSRP